jgi:hypothetical protein
MSQPPSNNDKKTTHGSKDNEFSSTVHTEEKNDTITNYCKYNGYHKHKISWPSKLTALCTLAIVFITFAYTYYAKKQVAQIAMQIELDQRAWVGVTAISGSWEVGKPVTITIEFKNTGKTPAINITIVRYGEKIRINELPNFDIEKIAKKEGIISTGTIMPGGIGSIPVPIAADWQSQPRDNLITEVLTGKQLFCIHGIINYEDIFRKPHWTTFCYIYNKEAKAYGPYDGHNDTDDTVNK